MVHVNSAVVISLSVWNCRVMCVLLLFVAFTFTGTHAG